MRLQKQTIFGINKGNCFSACLASLIDKDITEVPVFSDSDWFAEVMKYLYNEGYNIKTYAYRKDLELGEEFNIAAGTIKRGGYHAVIYKGHEPFFDPSPFVPDNTPIQHIDYIYKIVKR